MKQCPRTPMTINNNLKYETIMLKVHNHETVTSVMIMKVTPKSHDYEIVTSESLQSDCKTVT